MYIESIIEIPGVLLSHPVKLEAFIRCFVISIVFFEETDLIIVRCASGQASHLPLKFTTEIFIVLDNMALPTNQSYE